MSAASASVPHGAGPHGHPVESHAHDHGHEGKFHIFVQIAMVLAIITGLELLVIYLPIANWIIITSLMLMSAVKFAFVIFIFMHLRWDKAFCTILFMIGLILAGGTVWALLLIMGANASIPVGPPYDAF